MSKNNRIIHLLLLFGFVLTACSSLSNTPPPTQTPSFIPPTSIPATQSPLPEAQTSQGGCIQKDVSSAESNTDIFAANRRINRTINLGEALEFPNEGNWYLWGTTEDVFWVIQSAGFTAVRIPINFAAHTSSAPPYTVEPAFFEHVDAAVGYAVRCNLVAIINMHNFGEEGDVPLDQKEKFIAIWQQVAEHYQSYPDSQVYFELTNEPGTYLNASWNTLLGRTIEAVRPSNPTRPTIVTPVHWGSAAGLPNLKLPADPNLIVTFHYYEPMKFTHQGADWLDGAKDWLGTTWDGTTDQMSAIETVFNGVADWATENNVPIFLGEFGSLSFADHTSRVRWTKAVRETAEAHDFSWGYWDLCLLGEPTFGILNCNKYVFEADPGNTDMLHALIP